MYIQKYLVIQDENFILTPMRRDYYLYSLKTVIFEYTYKAAYEQNEIRLLTMNILYTS